MNRWSVKRYLCILSLATAFLASPAQAGDRLPTTTLVTVQPASGTFRDGDPIRVCYATHTEVVYTGRTHLEVQWRRETPGAQWQLIGQAVQRVNKTRCVIGQIQLDNVHTDVQLRVVTLRSPGLDWSVSRRVTLEVEQ